MKRKLLLVLGLVFVMITTLVCAVGCKKAEAHKHTWATEWSVGGETHWHACTGEGCTAKKDEGNHTGTAATCTAKAVCTVCNAEYGEKDPDNHDLEEHAAKAPTCTEIGWDAYVTCKRSGCTYTTYQEKAALGHDYTVQEKDDNQHWNKCSRCNKVDEAGKTNHSVATWETTDTGRAGKCSCGAIVITAVENVPVENITLYTVESLNGRDYAHTATYEYAVTVNGTAKEVTFTINGDAATFDKATNTFTAVKAGEITVTASYTIADGVSESKTFKVIVERPEITVETPVKYFSAIDGKDSSADMFVLLGDAEFTATQVYNGQSYTLTVDKENKTLKGAHAESKTPTVSTITLENDMFAVTYNVTVYTKVINDYTDFEDMRLTADRKTVEGYFIMNADIDFKGVEINGAKDNYNATFYPRFDVNSKPDAQDYITGAGFNGVFDGNGHDIKGYQAGNSFGFFGSIKGTSLKDMTVIKNVSFTNVYSGANWTLSRLFAQNAAFVSVENVYISFNLQSEWTARFALFGCGEANTFRFNNIVMEMTKAFAGQGTTDAGNNGGVGIFKDAGTTLWFATDTANNSGHYKGFTIYKNFYFVVPNASNGRVMPMFQNSSASVYASNDFVEFTTEGATATLNSSLNPEASESGTMKVYHLTNAYRYDNYEQMKEKTTKVGNWDITSGVPVWVA